MINYHTNRSKTLIGSEKDAKQDLINSQKEIADEKKNFPNFTVIGYSTVTSHVKFESSLQHELPGRNKKISTDKFLPAT